jgi:hypothetical protein
MAMMDQGSMVRSPATAPVVCANIVPDSRSFRDIDCPLYHAYVNAYISICECCSVGECRKVLEVSVEVFHHLFKKK